MRLKSGVIWALLAAQFVFASCATPAEKPNAAAPEPNPFRLGNADCSYPRPMVDLNKSYETEQVVSPDGRWLAITYDRASIHEFHLYDLQSHREYLIYHPNTHVGLGDFDFSADSTRLAFVGSAWKDFGLGEIFIANLESLTFDRFGSEFSVYRHPVLLPNGAMLFFEKPYHLGAQSRYGREVAGLASRSSGTSLIAYLSERGETTYLPRYTGGRVRFVPLERDFDFRDSPNHYEEVWAWGVTRSRDATSFQFYDGNTFRRYVSVQGREIENIENDEISRVNIEILNDEAYATYSEAIPRADALTAVRRHEIRADMEPQMGSEPTLLCLEVAQLK